MCSAFLIPGLGQVINQHLKKGACILLAVFIIFVTGVVKLYRILDMALDGVDLNKPDTVMIMDRLRAEDTSALWYLLIALGILWVYSVVDAYLAGKRIDQLGEGGSL